MSAQIHGSWFDPSNPVVRYSGTLRDDLYQRMQVLLLSLARNLYISQWFEYKYKLISASQVKSVTLYICMCKHRKSNLSNWHQSQPKFNTDIIDIYSYVSIVSIICKGLRKDCRTGIGNWHQSQKKLCIDIMYNFMNYVRIILYMQRPVQGLQIWCWWLEPVSVVWQVIVFQR